MLQLLWYNLMVMSMRWCM